MHAPDAAIAAIAANINLATALIDSPFDEKKGPRMRRGPIPGRHFNNSVELLQLFLHGFGKEGDEDLLLRHHVLALARQHEPQELLHLRLERLARLAVHVDADIAA